MKLLFAFLACFASFGMLYAQAPQGINYQAVARNSDTSPKVSTPISVVFKIFDGATLVYSEQHNTSTNPVGLFTLVIGQGSSTQGQFSAINWASGQKNLEVFINNVSTGTAQPIQSVPYALYAEKTATGANATDEMVGNNVFTTTVRGGEWLTMNSQLQVAAPVAGTYLVLYTLRATNFTDQDLVYFKITNPANGIDYDHSVLMSPQNGVNDVIMNSFYIANMTQGQIVQVREKMEGSGTSQVLFQDGKICLIKL